MPFLEVRGKKLFYARVDGKGEAKGPNPVLLFIHGLGSSHTFYIPVMHQLAESGYTSVALDVYGSAQSQLVSGVEAPTFETIVDDIIGLSQGLDIPSDNIVAVGHSMGGIVVPMLASKCRLQGAVLLGPVLPRAALADIFNARIETVRKDGMEPMAQTIPFAATGSKATLLQKAFIRTLLLSQKPEGYNALCGAIAKAEVPSYSTINSPVLVLAGEEDKTSPVADAQKIFDDWGCDASAKTMQVLPGVGHWHCIEAADAIAVGIAEFVSKLP